MIRKSIFIWLSIIPLAILNGAFRQGILEPLMGLRYANPVSCIMLCCLIFVVSFIFVPRLGKGTKKTYVIMGLLWVLLTIAFETTFGLLTGNTWNELISAYNITTGNLWLAVVVFVGIIPWLTARIKRII